METTLPYYLGFSHFVGIGPMRFKALLEYFNSVKRAYWAQKEEISKVIGSKLAEEFVRFRQDFDAEKKKSELKQKGIRALTQDDHSYPEKLKNLADPPICLYIKGKDVFPTDKLFAVVGTRKPTAYGQQMARKFASEIAGFGLIIVSGMAIGIDTVAHQAALEAGGRTVAVLGCGVDIVYPQINHRLYEMIVDSGGWVISEFPPGRTVVKGLFIARNRIISGLSLGVLVVEGAKDSGALITARYAAEQGRDVFALPSPITSPMAEAPNFLLKQGAKLATSADDIIEELGMQIKRRNKQDIELNLKDEEKIIFEILINAPLTADEIVFKTEKSVGEVLNLLTNLELKGVIEKNSEGRYQIRD